MFRYNSNSDPFPELIYHCKPGELSDCVDSFRTHGYTILDAGIIDEHFYILLYHQEFCIISRLFVYD